ncbi:hypothetical protein JXA32_13615, partial [Candidatus Sumerlaeota bacterium]|nr:hypothetical protein [Candidatus Sumerlaeota bacterium]
QIRGDGGLSRAAFSASHGDSHFDLLLKSGRSCFAFASFASSFPSAATRHEKLFLVQLVCQICFEHFVNISTNQHVYKP